MTGAFKDGTHPLIRLKSGARQLRRGANKVETAAAMKLADVHSELGCSLCGVINCGSMKKLKEHLNGKRHNAMLLGRQAESYTKLCQPRPAVPPPGRYPPGIVPASKVSDRRRIPSDEEPTAEVPERREKRQCLMTRWRTEKIRRERQEQKALHHRQEAPACKSKREKLHPDEHQPPAYEPARRLLFPGSHPMQPEEEALEGNWRIYAEMGWVVDLDLLQTPDILLVAAAPAVPRKGLIQLRRPGKETEKDNNGKDSNEDKEAPRRRHAQQPMLVGSWHLEHSEGDDKPHGMHPSEAQSLTTSLAPADITIFSSPCTKGRYANEEEEEEEEGEISAEEGEIQEERKEEEVDFCGWMSPSSWKCARGELVVPGKWDNGDKAMDIILAQLHVGDELKLRRLNNRWSKELSSLGHAKPEEAVEVLRAIWERPDNVVDLEAEPLLVRPGDMRIMVQFKEGFDHGGVTISGKIYLCRRDEGPSPPEVEPGMDAPPVDEQRFMGLCNKRCKGEVRSEQGQDSSEQENNQSTEFQSVLLQVKGQSVEEPQALVKHLKEHAWPEKDRQWRQEPQQSLDIAQEEERLLQKELLLKRAKQQQAIIGNGREKRVTGEESHQAPEILLREMKFLELKLNQQVQENDRLHLQLRAQETSDEAEEELMERVRENHRKDQELGKAWEESKELKKGLKKLEHENSRLGQELERAQEASTEAQKKLEKESEEKQDHLRGQLHRNRDRLKEAEVKLMKRVRDNDQMDQELRRSKESKELIRQAELKQDLFRRVRLKRAEMKLIKRTQENEQLQKDLGRAQEANEQLQKDLGRAQKASNKSESELMELVYENTRLRKSDEAEKELVKQHVQEKERMHQELQDLHSLEAERDLSKKAQEELHECLRQELQRTHESLQETEKKLKIQEQKDRLWQQYLRDAMEVSRATMHELKGLHLWQQQYMQEKLNSQKKIQQLREWLEKKNTLCNSLLLWEQPHMASGLRQEHTDQPMRKAEWQQDRFQLCQELRQTQEFQELVAELKKQVQENDQLSWELREAKGKSQAHAKVLNAQMEENDYLTYQLCQDLKQNEEELQEEKHKLKKQVQEKDQLSWELCEAKRESQAHAKVLNALVEEKNQLCHDLRQSQSDECQGLVAELKKQVQEKDQLTLELREAKAESQEHVRVLNAKCEDLRQSQEECQKLMAELKKQVQEKAQLSRQLNEGEEESQAQLRDLKSQVEEKDKLCEHLQADAVCPICVEHPADRALLCGHTFCHLCTSKLEQQELKQPQGSVKKMGCPVCRQSLSSLMPELDKTLKQMTRCRKRGRDLVDSIVSYPLKLFKS